MNGGGLGGKGEFPGGRGSIKVENRCSESFKLSLINVILICKTFTGVIATVETVVRENYPSNHSYMYICEMIHLMNVMMCTASTGVTGYSGGDGSARQGSGQPSPHMPGTQRRASRATFRAAG